MEREERRTERKCKLLAIIALAVLLILLVAANPADGTECCGCCFDNCGNFQFTPAGETTEYYWTLWFSYGDACGNWNVWQKWEHKCYKYNYWMICQKECYCCVTKKWEATGSPSWHFAQQITTCNNPWVIEIKTLPDGTLPY